MERSLNGENVFGLENQNVIAVISNEKERRSKPTALIILVWLIFSMQCHSHRGFPEGG